MTPQEVQHVLWFAVPDDLIGGWCVMPTPDPPSVSPHLVIASFAHEKHALHVAGIHNQWLMEGKNHQ